MSDVTGVDHYDENVLAVIDPDDPPSKLETVRLYQRHTKIVNRDTAKARAKGLWRRGDFPEVAGYYE